VLFDDFGIARHFKPAGEGYDALALLAMLRAEQYGRTQSTARTDIYALECNSASTFDVDDPAPSPSFLPLISQSR